MQSSSKSQNEGTETLVSKAIEQVKGKYVCRQCIDDTFLSELVERNKVRCECNYCGARSHTGSIAAPLEKIVEKIVVLFTKRTKRPEHNRPTPPRVGGHMSTDCDPVSTVAVLQGFKWTSNDGLLSYVAGALERASEWKWWVETPDEDLTELTQGELLDWSWLRFTNVVTHESRFHFLTVSKSPVDGMLDIGEVLDGIGNLVNGKDGKDLGLVHLIPKGSQVYRARLRGPTDAWNPDDPKEMGAPPRDKATAGRMNSAGIPHLYTAFEEQTALLEVPRANSSTPNKIALATFEIMKDLSVLDLTCVPPPPSDFDDQAQPAKDSKYFLAMFARDISLPVSKGGSEHIEYVPTQVVSEYFAQVFKLDGPESPGLDGVIYRSAACPNGKNLVLFPGNRRQFKQHPQFDSLLRFVDWRVTEV